MARVLARGWLRASRRWWWATAAMLGLVLGGAVASAGLLAGMQEGAHQRVADFFTGDVRLTPENAAPSASPGANHTAVMVAALEEAGGPGTTALPRLETQYILSRRGLVQAYLEERDGFGVLVPGGQSDSDVYGAGLLLGLQPEAAGRLQRYLVAGHLPQEADFVQLALSLDAFGYYLSAAERDSLSSWPPPSAELERFNFEITAGHIRSGGSARDIIRLRAQVVGLFDSGLDILDRFAALGTIGEARRLVGEDPVYGPANAISVWTQEPELAAAAVPELRAQSANEYAQAYVGQTLLVVEFLGAVLLLALLALPLALVWHGLQQMLDRQRRQIAVCRAIGVPASSLRSSLARLAGHLLLRSVLVAALLVGVAIVALPLAPADWSPLPIEPVAPWAGLFFTAAVTLLGMALALVLASRAVLRDDLGQALRV